jgi:threonine/homoserine/homoserine lactone efflux protein
MTEQLLAFAAASLVVIVVPGPDMMLMLRNTARAGRTGALWTAVGIMTGLGILATTAALGITALLALSPVLFNIIRIAGGLYLIYLGIQALRAWMRMRRQGASGVTQIQIPDTKTVLVPGIRAASFRQGLLCNLLNPKVGAFYLSLFPKFDLAPLAPIVQHVVLAAAFWTLCLLWYIGLVSLITRVSARLQSRTLARRTEATAGVALTGLGVVVLAHSA